MLALFNGAFINARPF